MDEYAAARKDTNTTDMVRNQEEELFAWNAWPPKLVASYPFGAFSIPSVNIGILLIVYLSFSTARWNEEVSLIVLTFHPIFLTT